MHIKLIKLLLFIVIAHTSLLISAPKKAVSRKGNFAHAMTPGTTFGFGQNIFQGNHFYIYPTFNQQSGPQNSLIQLIPAALYAFSDYSSLYVGLPIAISQTESECKQRGIQNLFMQYEYALIDHIEPNAEYMATIVANVAVPTTHLSSCCSYLQTFTAPTSAPTSFFVGTTVSKLSLAWYFYGSFGATINTSKNDIKPGTALCYQWGIGHNLGNPGNITALGNIEFNGIYARKDTEQSIENPNTGGNTLFIGPTLCLTGNRWFFSGGIQLATLQKLNGIQNKIRYRTSIQLIMQF